MKTRRLILFLLFTAVTAGAQAQMYRWVDSSGRVTYSDQPPPASVKAQKKKLAARGDDGGLTYSLSQAVKSNPVTLYTASGCAACDEGRALLKNRGIPFTEKTISNNADAERMKQAGGDGRLPFLIVGRNSQAGFEAGSWDAALTAAGYPETSQLPANYRYAPAQSAAPPAEKPTENGQPQPVPQQRSPQPSNGSAPPGFRF
ncbi:MAG: hypothetical protein H6R01_579 [Burkholderiaceae bacterium]|nr:hypothetical protein [Burkholderiaceae bacterium]